MFDAKSLLDQFLGAGNGAAGGRPGSSRWGDMANTVRGKLTQPGVGTFAGGAAAGGLLGVLLGSGKVRKMAGGVLGYGAAAAIGALAHKAYQNWQQGQRPADAAPATPADVPARGSPWAPIAAPTGEAFELALIRAMIGAAKADGHMDDAEQRRLFDQVDRLGLDAEAKAFVFDAMRETVSLDDIARHATTPEQAAEIYLASRLAIEPDHPAERAYLQALANRLRIEPELAAHLDRQVTQALAAPDAPAEDLRPTAA
jgi:uncharacterized membrane protein YebE (DUF533 family)